MSLTPVSRHGRRVLAAPLAALVAGVLGCALLVAPGLLQGAMPAARAADVTASRVLVAAEATWRYLDNDLFPSAAHTDTLSWTKSNFSDTAWKSGAGPFGARIADGVQSPVYAEARTASTQLAMNGASGKRVRSYFFRHTFELDASQVQHLRVARATLRVDDAALVHVNGTEVLRHQVTAGEEGLQYAPDSGTGLDTVALEIAAADLRVGTNVIALSLHNDRSDSSDIWFSMSDLEAFTADDLRPQPTRVILTPTTEPSTSQNITFQGAFAGDVTGQVEIRPVGGGELRSLRAPIQPRSISNDFGHFSATVTGLQPATAYTYRVASQGHWSRWYRFTTAAREAKDFRYLYYGDAQLGLDSTWPAVVRQAQRRAPDAVGSVHAGDLIDSSTDDSQWANWFRGMEPAAASTNVMAAPGNHDFTGDKLMSAWKAHFEYPRNNPSTSTIGALAALAQGASPAAAQHRAYFEHWASFAEETVYFTDYQGVRFITVNSTRDSDFLRPDVVPAHAGAGAVKSVSRLWTQYQAAWLDHVLASSPSKWNVVTFHQPIYSTSRGRDEPALRELWQPVFAKHDVDLVQMGHDHTYARGFTDTDATSEPGVSTGPVYMVANSGAKHYDLESVEKNVWTLNGATQVRRAQGLTTYQVVDVSADALRVRSYVAEIDPSMLQTFHRGRRSEASGLKAGDLWDEFTVHKNDAGRKAVLEAGTPTPTWIGRTPAFTADLPGLVRPLSGSDVRLDVTVDPATPATLQWQRKEGAAWVDLAGRTAPTLRLRTVRSNAQYRVVASAGQRTSTSRVVTVQVRRRAARVKIGTVVARAGRPAKVRLKTSTAGVATVSVSNRGVKVTKKVTLRAGRPVTLTLRKLPKRATGRATVRVRVATGIDHEDASASTRVRVRR